MAGEGLPYHDDAGGQDDHAHGAAAVGPTTPWGVLFGVASVVTPALLGAAAATASGAIRVSTAGAVSLSLALPWLTPFALDCALLGLALSAQQAAVYLAVEAGDAGEPALRRHFQRRARAALGVTAAATAGGLPLARAWAPVLAAGLLGRALPLLMLVALAGTGCAVALARGHARWGDADAPSSRRRRSCGPGASRSTPTSSCRTSR